MNGSTPPHVVSGAALDVEPSRGPGPFGVVEAARYEEGGLLGAGGMGEVRHAFDARLGRDVALKVASGGGSEQELVREARLTARLVHPNIVSVHDAGVDPHGRPFYTMPVLRGRSLADALAATTGTAERLTLVPHVLDAARAIAYAHGRGVLHRDLKPGNILVGELGETLVSDWGLAAEVGAAAERVGTPGYMAPEVAEEGRASPASDVYGLGATLWGLLAGRDPPSGRLPRLLEVAPDVPPELAAVVDRATAPLTADRYPDAASLSSDLSAWFQGRRVEAYAYTPAELLARLWRAYRLPLLVAAAAVAAVAAAIVVGVVATAVEAERARDAERVALAARDVADARLTRMLVSEAQRAATDGRPWAAEVLAAHGLSRGLSPQARGVLAQTSGRARAVPLFRYPLPTCAWGAMSPKGTRVACERAGAVQVFAPSSPETVLATAPGRLYHARWIDEEDLVLSRQDGELLLWHTSGAGPTHLLPTESGGGVDVEGGRVVLVTPVGVSSIDRATGVARRHPACGKGEAPAPEVMIWRGKVAIGCSSRDLWEVDIVGGGPARWIGRLDEEHGAPTATAEVRDGSGRVAVGTSRGWLVIVGANGVVEDQVQLTEGPLSELEIDHTRIAVRLRSGDAQVFDTNPLRLLAVLDDGGFELRWTDDGRLNAMGRFASQWSVPQATTPHVFKLEAGVADVDAAPHRPWIAAALGNGRVRVLSLADGGVVRDLQVSAAVVKAVSFSPDGRFLAVATSANEPQPVYDTETWAVDRYLEAIAQRRVAWWGDEVLSLPYAPGFVRYPRVGAPRAYALDMRFVDIQVADGLMLALEPDGQPWLWDAHTLAPVAGVHNPTRAADLLGGDLLTANMQRVELRTMPGGLLRAWETTERPMRVEASPDGTLFALVFLDGLVRVMDVEGGLLAELRGHVARVGELTWTPDGAWLITGAWDGTVRTWSTADLRTGADELVRRTQATWGRGVEEVLRD